MLLQETMIRESSQKWINKSFPNHKLIHNNKNGKILLKEGKIRTEKEIRTLWGKNKAKELNELEKILTLSIEEKTTKVKEIEEKYTEQNIQEEIVSTKINLRVNEGLTFIIKNDLFKHVEILPQASKKAHFLKLNLFPKILLINIHAPATSLHKDKIDFFEKLMTQIEETTNKHFDQTPLIIIGERF